MYRGKAGARLEGGSGGHHRGTDHAGAPGEDQRRAEVPLVAEERPGLQQGAHAPGLHQHEFGGNLLHLPVVEIDVEKLPLTHHVGVLLEEEGESRRLEGEGEVGMHHIAAVGVLVPLSEEPGGGVDRYYVCP